MCIPVGISVQKKEAPFFEACRCAYNVQYNQVYLPVDGAGEECGSHFSGLGDPLKTGPASNSVVMGGYRCAEPRNGPGMGSQVEWMDIKEDKLQLWSEVLETLTQEEGVQIPRCSWVREVHPSAVGSQSTHKS